jgi:hypothetical protein
MKAANSFNVVIRTLVFGLIVAVMVFAPLGAVSADGGGTGHPPPQDSTDVRPYIADPGEAYEPLITETIALSILRFVDL